MDTLEADLVWRDSERYGPLEPHHNASFYDQNCQQVTTTAEALPITPTAGLALEF
jgi:hypothetical protein